MCRSELPDQGEDLCTILYHGQGFPLGQLLIAVEEVTHPYRVTDHKGGPVFLTVKYKPRATGPLAPDCPYHVRLVILLNMLCASTRRNTKSLYVCTYVCFWPLVIVSCPYYEAVGFQTQAVDIPDLGSMHPPI